MSGLTLMELLIIIIVLGVLVSLALPTYRNMVAKARADQAVTYLQVIRTGEKIYYANNGDYVSLPNAASIKSFLGAEVTEEAYTFSVVADTINDVFTAIATNKSNPTHWIAINQDGEWAGTDPFTPTS